MLSLSLAESYVLPRRNLAKALAAGRTNAAPKCKDRVRNFLRSFRREARTKDHLIEPDTPEASNVPQAQNYLRYSRYYVHSSPAGQTRLSTWLSGHSHYQHFTLAKVMLISVTALCDLRGL